MASFLKWFYCLSKRLYKRSAFIILICLIPLSLMAFSFVAVEDAGFVRIAVVNNDGSGMGGEITDGFVGDTDSVRFIEYADEASAMADLNKEDLDAVWVLEENIEEKIAAFIEEPTEKNAIARVYMKENNLQARLPLEKLSAAVYPFAAKRFYLKFVRENPGFDLADLSDETIYGYYNRFISNGGLFRFKYPDGNTVSGGNETNYLLSPVRGILSVIVMICGFASAMLYINDQKSGTYSRAKMSNRVFISLAAQLTATVNIGVFMLIAVFVTGVNAGVLREMLISLIFIINSALFCTVIQQIFCNITAFASVATLLTVLQVLICPVFFNYTVQRIPQLIFPNTYYINSAHGNMYLAYSFIYMAVLLSAVALIFLRKRKN